MMLNGKKIEEQVLPIPIQAILADNNLQRYISTIDNPWVKLTLKIWKTTIKEYNLEGDIAIFKCCA